MKQVLIITAMLFSTNAAFGNCQSQTAKAKLFNMFKVEGQLSDWIGVGNKTSLRRDRAFPIYISQERTLQRSVINFRGQKLSLNGASICMDPRNSKRIILTHPDYDGALAVQKRGQLLEDSIIKFTKIGSLLTAYIRPIDVVK